MTDSEAEVERQRLLASKGSKKSVSKREEQQGNNAVSTEEVFSLFKTYLEDKLEQKGKQLEGKAKLDKQVAQMKYKGNQKQFELNAQVDDIFDSIKEENAAENANIEQLVNQGKELIRKRQKLIRIADKSSDGWKVVEEYLSDELASDSADDKRLRKAKEAVARKRKPRKQTPSYSDTKKFKSMDNDADQRFFRGSREYKLENIRCFRCQRLGHWAKDCRGNWASTSQSSSYSLANYNYKSRSRSAPAGNTK